MLSTPISGLMFADPVEAGKEALKKIFAGGTDGQAPLTGPLLCLLVAFLSKQQDRVVVDRQELADGKVAAHVSLKDSWVAPRLSFSVLAWWLSQV